MSVVVNNKVFSLINAFFGVALLLGLQSCGGGSDSKTPPSQYTIGVTVSGLIGAGLEVKNNAVESLSISADGDYAFLTPLEDSSTYSVTVLILPSTPSQNCTLSNATGVIAGANVSNILIECVDNISPLVISMDTSNLLANNAAITIVFNESMDADNLILSDSLATESDGGIWSSTNLSDDTLTISPNTRWSLMVGHVISVDVADISGNPLVTIDQTYDVYNTIPTVLNLSSEQPLGSITPIKIIFSETMDTTSLSLSGSLVAESDGGVWSSSNFTNDTLILAPNSNWTEALDATLTVDVNDLDAGSVNTVDRLYDIYKGTVYFVSSSAEDNTGDGLSLATAKPTINGAIDVASAPASVVVNVGVYNVNSSLNTHVVLADDISLYGGYDASFITRDPVSNLSVISDVNALDGGSSISMLASSGVTNLTLVDGFTINGSTQTGISTVAGVLVERGASPLLQNNIINAGTSSNESRGVYIADTDTSPIIRDNIINGGNSSRTYGIYSRTRATAFIFNNIIDGGNASSISYGISNSGVNSTIKYNTINAGVGGSLSIGIDSEGFSTGVIQNNTINSTTGSSFGMHNFASSPIIQNNTIVSLQYGIRNGRSGSGVTAPVIDNNIIVLTGSATLKTYCITEDAVDTEAASLRNNNLFGCTVKYLDKQFGCPGNGDGDGVASTCSIAEMESLTGFGAGGSSGNVSVDPIFIDIDGLDDNLRTNDNNWHFSVASPFSVTSGGLNGIDDTGAGWGYTDDMDNVPRLGSGSPWAIGSYEP